MNSQMNSQEKLQPLSIIICAFMGSILGIFTPLGDASLPFVELFLLLLLYVLFLFINFTELRKATLNIKYTAVSVSINFIFTPLLAYTLGLLFFEHSMEIRLGLLMLLVTPCTDWYLVFTKLSKGNVEINMSILPLNLLLQVLLLPLYVHIFLGNSVNMDMGELVKNIAGILLIPFIGAMLTRYYLQHKPSLKASIAEKSDSLQLLFLCLAVLCMFASEGKNLQEHYGLFLTLFLPLLCFFVITFFIVKIVGRVLRFNVQDLHALHMTTLARNSPLALAIAVAAFPDQPLISLALIIGPLIELPILSFVASLLRNNKATSSLQ